MGCGNFHSTRIRPWALFLFISSRCRTSYYNPSLLKILKSRAQDLAIPNTAENAVGNALSSLSDQKVKKRFLLKRWKWAVAIVAFTFEPEPWQSVKLASPFRRISPILRSPGAQQNPCENSNASSRYAPSQYLVRRNFRDHDTSPSRENP
ncbi:UNVERIFIED_CONTAM: hypothetical protein ABIC26_001637 [Paenibacillus sp. PvR008]